MEPHLDPSMRPVATESDRVPGSALRIDNGKARLDLLDPEFLRGIADALEYGTIKYSVWDWLKGWEFHRPYNSIQRHLLAYWAGEERDPETTCDRFPEGVHHLHMAACQLMFLSRMAMHPLEYQNFDNRPDLKRRSK